MIPSSTCKLIDFNSYRQHHRLRSSHIALRQHHRLRSSHIALSSVHQLSEKKRKLNQHHHLPHADEGIDLESHLRAFENSARRRCLKVYKHLSLKKFPTGLAKLLAQRILPGLDRIGFDRTISKVLFQIAPSAWNLMGPADESIIHFQPLIDREVEVVREGIKLKADQISDGFSLSSAASPGSIFGSLKEGIFPQQLFEMLDDIATPWIILPRAYRFLEEEHCRYLPVYLKILNSEKCECCSKLFSRITVEFMANFSFKFAEKCYPANQISKLLFYGYAALFWKTLRCPPVNMENSLAFDHFLIWIKRFARNNDLLGKREKSLIEQMLKMRTWIFPSLNTQSYRNRQQPDSSRFLVTLRHGHTGIAATLRHFGIDQFLKSRRTGKRFTCLSFQKELSCLFYEIRTHFHMESKHTQDNIKHFIHWFKTANESQAPDFNRTQKQFVDRLLNHMQKFVNT